MNWRRVLLEQCTWCVYDSLCIAVCMLLLHITTGTETRATECCIEQRVNVCTIIHVHICYHTL